MIARRPRSDAEPGIAALRESMIRHDIAARGIRDARVLEALRRVPREAFVPEELRARAYDDAALPIAEGQTISQPYIVALMSEALLLEPDAVVLEVGTGSGYAAAVLAELATRVISIERHAALADAARARLAGLGYTNVEVVCGDGSLGHPEGAPYDGISVTAAGPKVPEPLLQQLAVGGRLVMPVGPAFAQELVRVTRTRSDSWDREWLCDVRFVPLVGAEGVGRDP